MIKWSIILQLKQSTKQHCVYRENVLPEDTRYFPSGEKPNAKIVPCNIMGVVSGCGQLEELGWAVHNNITYVYMYSTAVHTYMYMYVPCDL